MTTPMLPLRRRGEGLRVPAMCASLFAVNAAAWLWAATAFAGQPVLLGTAFLAYAFGLRHAVDADHIAAIDNATRKLIEAGRRAAGTGLFFSLGHSSVVVLAVLAIALGAARLPAGAGMAAFGPLAAAIGTGVSAVSLFALAVANSAILVSVCRLFIALKRGGEQPPADGELARLLSRRGLLARLLRGLFRLIAKSWHMFPLGVLFGLGFDTATEIGLLAVSAAQAAKGLPLPAIMVFPALFTAGMVLIDSLDGLMMSGAYRWASADPYRRLYYNLAVTSLSVVVAVAIGGIEVLGLTAAAGSATGFWAAIGVLNDHFGMVGGAIVVLFALLWLLSALRFRRRAAPQQARDGTATG
jgi:nickel/cobalt transporter (NiCoT) family protein